MKAKQIKEQLEVARINALDSIRTAIEILFDKQEVEKEIYLRDVGSPITHQYIDDQHSEVIDKVSMNEHGVLIAGIDTGDDDFEVRVDELTMEQLVSILEQIEDLKFSDL